jgi:glycine dehydrogenase subunit 2
MIEPTETENKETIDYFCDMMIGATKLAKSDSKEFANLPKTLEYCRADDLLAIKQLDIRHQE